MSGLLLLGIILVEISLHGAAAQDIRRGRMYSFEVKQPEESLLKLLDGFITVRRQNNSKDLPARVLV